MAAELESNGYKALEESERWHLVPGGRYFVTRDGSALIAFQIGSAPLAEMGFRLIGAHTDSPGLRLRPHVAQSSEGWLRLGVEIYGGPILATFADRDLGLAGRVVVREGGDGGGRTVTRLLNFDQPLLRLPNLAIHLNREVNEQGLKFQKQNELPLLAAQLQGEAVAETCFQSHLAARLAVDPSAILAWELQAYDTQPGAFWGLDQRFIAHRQLDNLASCHAALSALLALDAQVGPTALVAFFDHEEVGSESATGAAGSFLQAVLARLFAQAGPAGGALDEEDRQRSLARSFFVSTDMAHAWHPNFPSAHEPCHRIQVNGGPAIKTHASQRYATGATGAARFLAACEAAGVPCQQYSHRADLGCGSTIGPILAARMGISGVDVGSPMWSMHSARESAGAEDQAYLIAALREVLRSTDIAC